MKEDRNMLKGNGGDSAGLTLRRHMTTKTARPQCAPQGGKANRRPSRNWACRGSFHQDPAARRHTTTTAPDQRDTSAISNTRLLEMWWYPGQGHALGARRPAYQIQVIMKLIFNRMVWPAVLRNERSCHPIPLSPLHAPGPPPSHIVGSYP